MKFEFDSPQIMAAWKQIMRENAEGMSVGLAKILEEVGVDSDPKIYLKEDLVIVKTINTDKGSVLVYNDGETQLSSKPYKLVADNQRYLAFSGKDMLLWFRRTGGVDHNTGKGFDNIDNAVKYAKEIDDPIVVAERIKQRDIEDGILDKDGNPIMQVDKEPKLEDAIPSIKK